MSFAGISRELFISREKWTQKKSREEEFLSRDWGIF